MKFDPVARLAARPPIHYDDALPVNVRRAEIAAAIQAHQVVVVCGETGSGKTTQLPKICLELGRGSKGLIGHTQPRRIAARATATRIAQELQSDLGRYVGYKIRFTDHVSEESYIKLMTDGILLAETQGDPLLRRYDTLLIDEAHERSLNIDFLLGYLKQLLPRRRDLKVIITSATLDAERFSGHFDGAPVIEVSGRLHPIEMRYRPYGEDDDRDVNEAIVDAVSEAHRAGPGDVLVFLPGEREIREAAEALRKHAFANRGPALEILPLFARQSAQEQARIFAPHQGRRVVLATNVAETSLTVPGIRYVVDSGLARVKRYSHRHKIEQLQVEPIAQAAAKQRAGRCGRVAAGVCFRLYSEEDFNKRPAYTDPEILRSSLAGVILRMKSLRLGGIEEFPFLQAPLPRMIADGYQLLAELGAMDETSKELTPVGQELAKLPLDPKIGRMILAARERQCLREMLVIASALSVQDPRDRPAEHAGAADQAHARWKDERSEFLSWLKLWTAADEVWRHESTNKQRGWCRQNFISWLRLREWRDVHGQLLTLCTEHGWRITGEAAKPGAKPAPAPAPAKAERAAGAAVDKLLDRFPGKGQKPAPAGAPGPQPTKAEPEPDYEGIHKALLSGLLGHIGLRNEDEKNYLGARGIKFFIHPGSPLAKKGGRWVVAAEIVETSRLFARCVARIEPEWLEEVGAHLIRRHVYEPHWEKGTGQVAAWQRITLHGLVLEAKRRVHYGPLDETLSRELLIRHALVQGEVGEDWLRQWRFMQHNLKLMRDIEHLEQKSRRPDVLVDEDLIHAFYDARLPAGITTVAAFDHWRREAERGEPKLLFLERDQLMRHEAAGITTDAFPPVFEYRNQKWKLSYKHDPGGAEDGITLSLPLASLNQVPAQRLEWLVPGLLKEKVVALLKTLPQKYRHRLQPLAAWAEQFCDDEHDTDEALVRALTRAVEESLAMKLPLDAFRPGELAAHLAINYRLLAEHGGTLALSRNLAELRARFGDRVERNFAQAEVRAEAVAGNPGDVAGLTSWSFGDLPELLEVSVNGRSMVGFPALVDETDSVALRAFDTEDKARAVHYQGLTRLFVLALKEQLKAVEKSLPRELGLQFMPLGTEKVLKEQLVAATLARTCLMEPLPTTKADFEARALAAKGRVVLVAQEIGRLLGALLAEYTGLQKKLATLQKILPAACADVTSQCGALLQKGFIASLPFERLAHLPRYLKGANLRLDKARADPARDARWQADWQLLAKPWERERLILAKAGQSDPFLEEFRWLLEELRIALFAQELKTPSPVSVKRLQKMWEGRER